MAFYDVNSRINFLVTQGFLVVEEREGLTILKRYDTIDGVERDEALDVIELSDDGSIVAKIATFTLDGAEHELFERFVELLDVQP